MINRESSSYQDRKSCWELTQTTAWQSYLQPHLKKRSIQHFTEIPEKVEDIFKLTATNTKAKVLLELLSGIERKVDEYINTKK